MNYEIARTHQVADGDSAGYVFSNMTLDELLAILRRDRRITVTADNIDAVSLVPRDQQIILRRRQRVPSKAQMRTFGLINRLIELSESEEPRIGDFLHVNWVENQEID